MEVETRKVQKLGYSSVGISLPKGWAVEAGLKPGSIVTIAVEDDGALRVRPGPLEEAPAILEGQIDADEWVGREALTRVITGNYIVGCNTIRIRARDELTASQLQEIHDAVRGLTGLTIVNQGPKFVTIENFAEPTRFPLDGLLRRLHYLTSRMEKFTLGMLMGEVQGSPEEVVRMEGEVDRLYWLVVRQLLLAAKDRGVAGKIGETEPRHIVGDRVVAVMLENIGDLWEEMAQGIEPIVREKRAIKEFAEGLGPIRDLVERQVEMTMTGFFAMDLGKANDALEVYQRLEKELRQLSVAIPAFRGTRKGDFCPTCTKLRSVLRPVEHIAKYYSTIAQLTINRALEMAPKRLVAPAKRAP